MDKRLYLKYKEVNPALIAYEYYKEHFHKTSGRMATQQEFQQVFPFYPGAQIAMQKAVQYYDNKFAVTYLIDKNNTVIQAY